MSLTEDEKADLQAQTEDDKKILQILLQEIEAQMPNFSLQKKLDTSELREFVRPPLAVQEVQFGVMLMLGYPPKQAKEWVEAQKLMKEKSFSQSLDSFNPIESFNADTHHAISKLMSDSKCMKSNSVSSVSSVANELFTWLKQIHEFHSGLHDQIAAAQELRIRVEQNEDILLKLSWL